MLRAPRFYHQKIYGDPSQAWDIDFLISSPRIALPGLLDRFGESGFEFSLEQVLRDLGEDHLSSLRMGKVRVDFLDAVIPLFRRTIERAMEGAIRECCDEEKIRAFEALADQPR